MAAKRHSTRGTTWSEADYAAHGYGMLRVRIPATELERLRALALEWDVNVTAAVRHLIAHAHKMPPPPGPKSGGG